MTTQTKQYSKPICRGSILLGSACMQCDRCKDEREALAKLLKTYERPHGWEHADDMGYGLS